MYNLIDGGIQHSNLFVHMPIFDEIYYEGYLDGKVRRYTAVREEQPCRMLVLNVIRQEEEVIWDALEDLLKRCIIGAGGRVRGAYIFDLLTMDIHREVKTFTPGELTTVVVNATRKLAPGAIRLVKYSSIYGLLQKTVHEDWGKVVLKTSVEVFRDKPAFFDLLVKQLLENFEFSNDPGILLLNDLSQTPLFDAADGVQQKRLAQAMEEQIPSTMEFPPEIYVQDKNGVRELLSGSVI